jgi:methylglutaconyl-CoA hydratase
VTALTSLSIDGGIATVTLDDQPKRNALSAPLVGSLLAHLDTAITDDAVRVIVIAAAGPVFCAGADLTSGGLAGGGAPAFVAVFEAIDAAPKPVVARVQGPAIAGGLGLACGCDIVIAADSVTLGLTEVRIGVAPAIISRVVLPRLRAADAAELFLGGERISARRAAEIGLVNVAIADDELDAEVERWCDRLLLGGPLALAATKRLLRDGPGTYAQMAELSASLFASDEGAEGMGAFREKRRPRWAT